MKKKALIIIGAAVVLAATAVFFAMQYTPSYVLTVPRAEALEIVDGNLVIPEKYTVIDVEALAGRIEFTSVEIMGEAKLMERCFYGCPNLEKAVLYKNVDVGEEAFADCSSLKSVTFAAAKSDCALNAFDGHSGIVIHCVEGSKIAELAQKADITYKILGEEQ